MDKSEDIVFCEIASRVGGGGIISGWIEAFNINLKQELIRMQAGYLPTQTCLDFNFRPKTLTGYAIFPKKDGVIMSIPQRAPYDWVKEFEILVKIGDQCTKGLNLNEAAGDIKLFTGSSESVMRDRVSLLGTWFEKELVVGLSEKKLL